MPHKNHIPWIEAGYQLVAKEGFESLNIEVLSRKVGKNKSSFYHYFGELELFRDALLDKHIQAACQFAEEASSLESMQPEVMNLMIDRKDDLFFHKQLRINRADPAYKSCFDKAYQLFHEAILDKWSSFMKLQDQPALASTFLTLASENFLLRITYSTFTFEWLEAYLAEFAAMRSQINQHYRD